MTLEGISGMVVMDAKTGVQLQLNENKEQFHQQNSDERPLNNFETQVDDIRKGESGGASSSSSSDHIGTHNEIEYQNSDMLKTQYKTMQQSALDLDAIKIDQKELQEISNSSRELQEKRKSQHYEFSS